MNESTKVSKPVLYLATFVVFALAAVASIPLRYYDLLNLIESSTGFYIYPAGKVFYMLNGCLIGVILLCALLAFLGKGTSVRPLGRNVFLSIASFLFAFSLIGSSVTAFYDYFISNFSTTYLTTLGEGIFGILSSTFFLITGISFMAGTDTFAHRGLLASTPIFWLAMRIIKGFSVAIDYKNVSELLYQLVMFALAMLFFMAFARIYVTQTGYTKTWKIFGFGLPTALFAFVLNIPRAFLSITNPEKLVEGYPLSIVDLTMGVFIIVCAISFISGKRDLTLEIAPEEEKIINNTDDDFDADLDDTIIENIEPEQTLDNPTTSTDDTDYVQRND